MLPETVYDDLARAIARLTEAIERVAPPPATERPALDVADAFVWHAEASRFEPVPDVARMPLALLIGIDHAAATLLDNTRRFAESLPANNALLWGVRGMGKSSLVKAAHAEVARTHPDLKLVEIHREDIATLPACLARLKDAPARFIVFADDLTFDGGDTSYKSLKAVLEGGIEGRPGNVIFYATSNRRHLMPRDMIENERATAINPSEATEEKVSLSDRFGLWLGFHNCSEDDYLAMVRAYRDYFALPIPDADLEPQAHEWSMTRGARSGRVAWQFTQDLAGRMGQRLET
ncbi:MAG: ATP-binding protein [Hyphomicrobium sp.]|nr:ATP-binding protein [Hyphomicrobium sp.]